MKSFKEYYLDVIYVSANLYVDSKVEIIGSNTRRHSYKVIDVWDFDWDEELYVISLENMTETTLSLVLKIPGKRSS